MFSGGRARTLDSAVEPLRDVMGLNQRNASEGGCPFDNLLKPPNLSSCGIRPSLVLAQGGGCPCHAESNRCLEGRSDGESDATGSQMVQGRVPVGVSQLRYTYCILHILLHMSLASLQRNHTDSQWCGQVTLPSDMPPIHFPEHQHQLGIRVLLSVKCHHIQVV